MYKSFKEEADEPDLQHPYRCRIVRCRRCSAPSCHGRQNRPLDVKGSPTFNEICVCYDQSKISLCVILTQILPSGPDNAQHQKQATRIELVTYRTAADCSTTELCLHVLKVCPHVPRNVICSTSSRANQGEFRSIRYKEADRRACRSLSSLAVKLAKPRAPDQPLVA